MLKKYIVSLLSFVIVNPYVCSIDSSLLSMRSSADIYNRPNSQKFEYSEDDEECELDLDIPTVHTVVKSSDCEILDEVITFIGLAKEMFIPEKYNVFEDSNYCLNISIQPTISIANDLMPMIEITQNASYLMDITYNQSVSVLDRYLFDYDKYRFSSYSYIEPWYKTNLCEFSIVDNFLMGDFFICWSFEVYCGKIIKAYLIDGFCEYLVYDLISRKEITMYDYKINILNRKLTIPSL